MRIAEIPNLLEAGRQTLHHTTLGLGDWSFPVTTAGVKRGFLEAFSAMPTLGAVLQWWNVQLWFAVAKPCWFEPQCGFEGHQNLADSRAA